MMPTQMRMVCSCYRINVLRSEHTLGRDRLGCTGRQDARYLHCHHGHKGIEDHYAASVARQLAAPCCMCAARCCSSKHSTVSCTQIYKISSLNAHGPKDAHHAQRIDAAASARGRATGPTAGNRFAEGVYASNKFQQQHQA